MGFLAAILRSMFEIARNSRAVVASKNTSSRALRCSCIKGLESSHSSPFLFRDDREQNLPIQESHRALKLFCFTNPGHSQHSPTSIDFGTNLKNTSAGRRHSLIAARAKSRGRWNRPCRRSWSHDARASYASHASPGRDLHLRRQRHGIGVARAWPHPRKARRRPMPQRLQQPLK